MATTFVLVKRSGQLLAADAESCTFSPQLAWSSDSVDDALRLSIRLNNELAERHGAFYLNSCAWILQDLENLEATGYPVTSLEFLAELYVSSVQPDGMPGSVHAMQCLRRGFLSSLARRDEERAAIAPKGTTQELATAS